MEAHAEQNPNQHQTTINPKWIAPVIAMPIAIALWLHLPLLVQHAQEIIKAASITTMIIAGLFTLLLWLLSAAEYTLTDYHRDQKVIKKILIGLVITSSAVLIAAANADWSHILTGVAAGLTAAGAMTLISGAAIATLEARTSSEVKNYTIIQTAQAMTIAGAIISSAGIVLLCRNQLPL